MGSISTSVASQGSGTQGASQDRFSRERLTVSTFVTTVQNAGRVVGFKELAECGEAVATLKRNNADPGLVGRYEGSLVPAAVRNAVDAASAVARAARNPASERLSIKRFDELGQIILHSLKDNFDSKTLPAEARLLRRFRDTQINEHAKGENALSPADFGKHLLTGRDALRKAELLVQYAELGGKVTTEMAKKDAGDLDGFVARAAQAAEKVGKAAVGIDMTMMDRFGTDAVKALLKYASNAGREAAFHACARDLKELSEYAESPTLGGKITQMVRDLGAIAAHSNKVEESGRSPTEGLGDVVRGCLTLLKEHSERAGNLNSTNDQTLTPAVNGFAAEAEVAKKFLDGGHRVVAVGRHVPLGPGQGAKEIDTVIELNAGAGKPPVLLVVEVKANANAVNHSFERYGDRQLVRLAQAAVLTNATAVLQINEPVSEGVAERLRQVDVRCKEVTGKSLFVIGPDLKPINLNPSRVAA